MKYYIILRWYPAKNKYEHSDFSIKKSNDEALATLDMHDELTSWRAKAIAHREECSYRIIEVDEAEL